MIPENTMIKFSEDMLIDLNVSEELKSLSEIDTFVRFDLSYPRF